MKIKITTFLLFSIILAGCNFLAEPTVNPTALSTIVSGALTASAVSIPSPIQTTTLPLKTIVPSSTVTKPQVPTLTMTASPSLTTTRTATLDIKDPKITLGKPTWEDKFHDGGNWGLVNQPYDDGSTRVEIKNDSLYFLSKVGQGWHGWAASYIKPQKYYLEATVHNINCGNGDYYGILFQATDKFNGYWFGVSCQGKFNFRTGGINGWKEPIPAEANATIQAGANKTNRLGVMVKGSEVTLYINGKSVKTITENSFTNPGVFGMFIVGWNAGFAFETEEMVYWELP